VDHINIVKSHRDDGIKTEKELANQARAHEFQLKQLNEEHHNQVESLNLMIQDMEASKIREIDRLQSRLEVHLQTVI
jgi:hypothetical protein